MYGTIEQQFSLRLVLTSLTVPFDLGVDGATAVAGHHNQMQLLEHRCLHSLATLRSLLGLNWSSL